MQRIDLPRIGTFDAWRSSARAFASGNVPPEDLMWVREGDSGADLFATSATPPAATREVKVPKAFIGLAKLAAHHRDPERFALLYRLLVELQATPRMIDDRGHPLVDRLNRMAKEVGRDRHKMHAFLRFRDLGSASDARRSFAAWFEPTHPILEIAAPFFANRFGDMDWAIFTPDLSARFETGEIGFAPPAPRPDLPEDGAEDLWRTYFKSIFNPARLKVKAMQAEMPKKYWANMPEADLIPDLIAQAETRAAAMARAAPTLPPLRAAKVKVPARPENPDQFNAALSACTRCPIHATATQAVPGEGPLDAALMIVGEQPGDQEDLAGRPFVGPAGQVFDRVMQNAGLDRAQAYVTNAVKHFKFTPRGKRRMHQSPNRMEIQQCRWWLDLERERVRPDLIIAMGRSAVFSLTGRDEAVLARRGTIEPAEDGTPVLITVHPSYVLRLPDTALRQEEEHRLSEDLRLAARLLAA